MASFNPVLSGVGVGYVWGVYTWSDPVFLVFPEWNQVVIRAAGCHFDRREKSWVWRMDGRRRSLAVLGMTSRRLSFRPEGEIWGGGQNGMTSRQLSFRPEGENLGVADGLAGRSLAVLVRDNRGTDPK